MKDYYGLPITSATVRFVSNWRPVTDRYSRLFIRPGLKFEKSHHNIASASTKAIIKKNSWYLWLSNLFEKANQFIWLKILTKLNFRKEQRRDNFIFPDIFLNYKSDHWRLLLNLLLVQNLFLTLLEINFFVVFIKQRVKNGHIWVIQILVHRSLHMKITGIIQTKTSYFQTVLLEIMR